MSDGWVAVERAAVDPVVARRAAASQASLAESLEELRSYRPGLVDIIESDVRDSSGDRRPPVFAPEDGLRWWSPSAPDGVVGLLDGYRSGALDPVAVMADTLERLDADAAREAVVTRFDAAAVAAGAESARRWQHGEARPLEGIPFCAKDNLAVAGTVTTAGSQRLEHWVPARTAAAVQRLRDAGAILVGKTALPEWGFGDARPGHEPTNPWSPDHWTGGSSSGSAVALAARVVPLALGTDTGGSIRVPASYCGVTGLKPSYGSVPRAGLVPVSSTLDHVGPMARSAVDAAIALDVLTGAEARPLVPPAAGLDENALAGMRVGVLGGWFEDRCDPSVLAARDEVARVLGDLGATVSQLELPGARMATTAAWVITVCEFASVHDDRVDYPDGYTASAAERIETGAAIAAADHLRALRVRADLQRQVASRFADVDVLLAPGTPTPAPRLAPTPGDMFFGGDRMWMHDVARHLIGCNLLRLPSVVVPAGFAPDPVRPVSVQFVADHGRDHLALMVASAWQAANDAHLTAPPGAPATP
ncbi:MAG: amidase [Actinomycetota bacterium]|nr:amidase [Actinomycetota bacterium]